MTHTVVLVQKLLEPHGDTLAEFVAGELQDTFDADATTEDQILEAQRALGVAVCELKTVWLALQEKLGGLLGETYP